MRDGTGPRGAPSTVHLPHLPGIDGLRAVAVAAVLLYHAGIAALPGGFLGVEVFFVISGYLITGLLLAEWQGTGRISLRGFWFRRARRLLPALFLVLAATLLFAVLFVPDEVARLRSDAAAAAIYVSNWYLVFGEQSYFETAGRQSPLLHLWSLAVEEQFYVVWPVVLAVGLWLVRRRGMLVLTAVGALASVAWMAALYDPSADPSRVYYGTDTRLGGLLLGALLAFVWIPAPPEADEAPRGRAWAADLAVVGGALVLAAAFAVLDGLSDALYLGGFAVVGLATVALIAGAVHPAGRLGRRVLEWAPLRWLGTRSYGVYLWHWPIFSITRPGLDVALDGLPLLVVRLVATALLAELSFRLVEWPIRQGVLGRTGRRWREEAWRTAPGARSAFRTRVAALSAAALLSTSGLLVTVATATPPEARIPDRVSGVIDRSPPPSPGPSPSVGAPAVASPAPSGSAGRTPSAPPATPAPTPGLAVFALGDSILIDAAGHLAEQLGRVEVDAAVGRHVAETLEILAARRAAGTLPEVVVLNTGVNGPLLRAQFEQAMTELRDVPLVLWVTVKVPRPWEEHTNKVILQNAPRYPNARVVDWYAAVKGRSELFWKDGYHPRAEGAALYARMVAQAIAGD